ncbi:DNA polymerase III subunit gamma/tau [Patescibacteria group bacterium]|nr:DNA polymerase III subunit gamma/tau [Patescibacteria group bacterium]
MVIYRKYRPQTFSEVIGQDNIVRILENEIKANKVAHAYLFTGPRGLGKTTVARLIAKAVNCQKRKKDQSEPCNQCPPCLDVIRGRFLDLIELDAASQTGVDNVRENIIAYSRIPPTIGEYKVFVIDECLDGDHLISMSNGTYKKISEIKNGDKILSVDLKRHKIVTKTVSKYFKRQTDKTVIIKAGQTNLKCTPTHSLWVLRDGEFCLIPAKDVKLNDYLISPTSLPHVQKNKLTPNQLKLIALIQCDGHVSKDSNTIQIEIKKDKSYFEKTFKQGLRAWKIKERPVITRTKRGTKLIRVYSSKLKNILKDFNCPSGNKHSKIDISDKVFQAPLRSIKAYLDTCFCCEGDASYNNRLYKLSFNITCKVFAQKLQLLLKKFGIASSLMEIKRKNQKHSTLYCVNLTGYDLRLFQRNINLSLKRKAKIIAPQLKTKEKQDTMPVERLVFEEYKKSGLSRKMLKENHIFLVMGRALSRKSLKAFIKLAKASKLNKYLNYRYEKVKKVEINRSNQTVYDFTVNGTHTFLVDSVISSNCHMLSISAFNALLKTLEEPPEYVIFILATTEIHKLPETIVSRCQRFDFAKVDLHKIVKRLEKIVKAEKIKVDDKILKTIAVRSEGCVRDAESLLNQILALDSKEITFEEVTLVIPPTQTNLIIEFLELIFRKDDTQAIKMVNQLISEGVNLEQFVTDLIEFLRKIILTKVEAINDDLYWQQDDLTQKKIKDLSKKAEIKQLVKIIEEFIQTKTQFGYSEIPQLPLELAVLKICED